MREEGRKVSIARLCRWFGVPRSSCDAHGTDVLVGVDYGRTWITHLIPWTPAYDWKRPDDESPGNESR